MAKADTIKLTEDAVREYLDGAITNWRTKMQEARNHLTTGYFIGLPTLCGICRTPKPDRVDSITDGYQTWYPCDEPPFKDGACRLEVVRLGKVQCECDDQGMPCLDCELPMFDRWAVEEMNVPFAIAQHEVVTAFGHDNGMRLQCGVQVECRPEFCSHEMPPRRCEHICEACKIDEGNG